MELREIEAKLERDFAKVFRRIWVQRSRYGLCITAFPIDPHSSYRIGVLRDIYQGHSDPTKMEDAIRIIEKIIEKNHETL